MSVHNLEAEQAVLGAVLFDSRLLGRITLSPEHFYDPSHGSLWAEMQERYKADRLVDGQALKEWAAIGFKELGGIKYLMTLLSMPAALSSQAVGYAEMIRDLSRRRAVIAAARDAISAAEGGSTDGATVRSGLETKLQEIALADHEGDAWKKLGVSVLESIERARLGETKGISTGIRGLDEATGGLKPGVWVVGGATSMGKSIFGAAISRNVAAQGYGVAEHHLEMTEVQYSLRAASALAFDRHHAADNAYYLSALRGDLKESQWDKLTGTARAMAHLPIYTDDRPGRTVSQIEAATRRMLRKWERERISPGCVLIDHEGLIAAEHGERHPSQLERTNARAMALLGMAKRLNVCVIVLSQITKDGARADGDERLPTLLDLNYGGAISQAADTVILLHRKAYFEERKPSHLRDVSKLRSRETTLVVDKTRSGKRGHVTVFMDPPTAAVWEEAA